MVRPALLSFFLLLAAAVYAADWACTTAEQNCKPVFIVHSSWHAAIVLRKIDISPDLVPELVDFPRAEFIEFSWGDKDYFPDPNAGLLAALRAAFWSEGSVMHVVGFTGKVADFYPGAAIIELRLSAPSYTRLLTYVSQTFSRPRAGYPAVPKAGLFVDSRFYPAIRKFSLLKTCNGWVAEALESAGLPMIPSRVITAGQLAEQIDKVRDGH